MVAIAYCIGKMNASSSEHICTYILLLSEGISTNVLTHLTTAITTFYLSDFGVCDTNKTNVKWHSICFTAEDKYFKTYRNADNLCKNMFQNTHVFFSFNVQMDSARGPRKSFYFEEPIRRFVVS